MQKQSTSTIKVGITGQSGFIGTHLYNYLGLKQEIKRVPFEDSYFDNPEKLKAFVRQCQVIVHFAAMNRHNDPETLYKTNIILVEKLINACVESNCKPHILFSSSTQEEKDNPYGKSKLEGKKLFENWGKKNNARFTGLVIPNVFGPFGNPYYNSVVATFSHQLNHNEKPEIHVDGLLKLIYINELTEIIYQAICQEKPAQTDQVCSYQVPNTSKIKVTQILNLLESFKSDYIDKGIFPDLTNPFERDLFNTFVCYMDISQKFPVNLKLHTDDRGSFVETIKLNSGGQVSFSTTKPGITRGNHFHTRKAERFAVIKGKAQIQLRRIGTGEVLNFYLDGNNPAYVDMPIWYTHNITNIGDEDLYTIFWISEQFNESDPDTFFEAVEN